MGTEWHLGEFVDDSLDIDGTTTIEALGEVAARRAADLLSTLRAGRDADVPGLNGPIARKLRQGYGDVWRTWLKLDIECDFGWSLADIGTEPTPEARSRAYAFSLDEWWTEVGTGLDTEFRRAVTLVGRQRSEWARKRRSTANKILNTLRLERGNVQWSFTAEPGAVRSSRDGGR